MTFPPSRMQSVMAKRHLLEIGSETGQDKPWNPSLGDVSFDLGAYENPKHECEKCYRALHRPKKLSILQNWAW